MARLLAGAVIGIAVGVLVGAAMGIRAQELREEYVRVTYYTLPGQMADGAAVRPGAAACSQWMPFGTQLTLPDGYQVTCEDRGLGDLFWAGWIDIWAPSRAWGASHVAAAYGPYAWTTVERWGWGNE